MTNDDDPVTHVHSRSVSHGYTTSTSSDEPASVEDRLFEIAYCCHVSLRRLNGESLRSVANRLTLEIEHRIGFSLLNLQEIATLHLDEDEDEGNAS